MLLFTTALAFFTALGLPFAHILAPRGVPALALAPSLGWAGFTVLALPILSATGFSTLSCWGVAVLAAGAAGWVWVRHRAAAVPFPAWAFALAMLMGLLPMAAILPKGDGLLAPPMFDHVKIAVVDGILRSGLPVANPFYRGAFDYYYLWHFGAAVVARLAGAGGWTAEAAMTGFTATASILLVMGLAQALGGRALALVASALLCLPGSARPVLGWLAGSYGTNPFIPRKSDIGGWLNQAAWVPQHLSSACCVVVAGLLMLRLAEEGEAAASVALGLVVAAGFESSSWVGGVTFAVSGAALGLWLLWSLPATGRRGLIGRSIWSLLILGKLIAPFVVAAQHFLLVRQAGPAVALMAYPVFGRLVPEGVRPLLDVPGYWVVMLPFALPALAPLAACAAWRPRILRLEPARHRVATMLAILAGGALVTSWLGRSTIENNDLGWRAILPALLILPAFAAVVLERLSARARAPFLVLACLGVPEAATMLHEYVGGVRPGDPAAFADTAPAWRALQAQSAPDARVASNPDLAAKSLFWPVNPAWALLSDRPSCYAGRQSVVAYGVLTHAQLDAVDARFARVFGGHAQPADVQALAEQDDCSAALVTRRDGAWLADPFAGAPAFSLAETGDGWRLYRRAAGKHDETQ